MHISFKGRRLLLGAFLLYLFGLLGYQGASHGHDSAQSHSDSETLCQLCQATAQPYAAPVPALCPEFPAILGAIAETVRGPALAFRHPPFSSRAPPSA